MCKVGDIILVFGYKTNGVELDKHSFIVVSDEAGEIQGLPYDMLCNVMSSFKNDKHKEKKLKYPGNLPITYNDTEISPTEVSPNKKECYIKADQLYYFNKEKINFKVIGCH